MLGLAGQLLELEWYPSAHESVIAGVEAENELITGGWFGRIDGSRDLRCPAKNWKPKPFESLEGMKPSGKPLDVAANEVPGTITIPRPGTFTPVIWATDVLASFATNVCRLCSFIARRNQAPKPHQ